MNPSFTVSWKIEGQQEGLLTCLAISPKGTRLVVASEDQDLLLVDVSDGRVLVKLDFEKQFSVLAVLWCSESNVIVGCSNGSLYDVCFKPTNRNCTVTMVAFLTPFNQQIRSLAFDPTRHLLAIGYSNMVALFIQEDPGHQYLHSEWKSLEVIKGPCNNESGLVHALLFYPTDKGTRNLLIGYAESGWNVWSNVGSVKRIGPDLHNVRRIGRASLASDKKSIAVSTLDQTIAIYALGEDGPILTSMKEFHYSDSANYSPIVPIALTPGGLTLGGTASGELPVIKGAQDDVSLMRHEEPNHVIRGIAVCRMLMLAIMRGLIE
ncbi:hypothetical protein FRC08_017100 [Ceratobasidium sp. 394]|nr:hypothetical protein FRC08_017100 [Ceratobasidium sp. 394]